MTRTALCLFAAAVALGAVGCADEPATPPTAPADPVYPDAPDLDRPSPQPQPGPVCPPTDAERYAGVLAAVAAGQTVPIAVGPRPAAFVHETFPSGYLGIRDGVYDCYLSNGTPSLKNRDGGPTFSPPVPVAPISAPVYPPLGGCPGGVCPVPRR